MTFHRPRNIGFDGFVTPAGFRKGELARRAIPPVVAVS